MHRILFKGLLNLYLGLLQVLFLFPARRNHNNRHFFVTDGVKKEEPIGMGIISDSPSNTKDEQAHAIKFADESVKPLDCLPVRNAAFVSFVEPHCVVDK